MQISLKTKIIQFTQINQPVQNHSSFSIITNYNNDESCDTVYAPTLCQYFEINLQKDAMIPRSIQYTLYIKQSIQIMSAFN